MEKSVTFLDYHGNVDFDKLELLLHEFKRTKEFVSLNEITGRRTYAILVECLENIYNHSSLKSSKDKKMQPHISVSEENDKIIITTGNLVSHESKEKLSKNLDSLNQSDEITLRNMHENILARASKQRENGSGLGLVDIAIKSRNKTRYNFIPITNDYFYFELRIFINK
jgi:hypothetical protein